MYTHTYIYIYIYTHVCTVNVRVNKTNYNMIKVPALATGSLRLRASSGFEGWPAPAKRSVDHVNRKYTCNNTYDY